jgi:hypothetical protein
MSGVLLRSFVPRQLDHAGPNVKDLVARAEPS